MLLGDRLAPLKDPAGAPAPAAGHRQGPGFAGPREGPPGPAGSAPAAGPASRSPTRPCQRATASARAFPLKLRTGYLEHHGRPVRAGAAGAGLPQLRCQGHRPGAGLAGPRRRRDPCRTRAIRGRGRQAPWPPAGPRAFPLQATGAHAIAYWESQTPHPGGAAEPGAQLRAHRLRLLDRLPHPGGLRLRGGAAAAGHGLGPGPDGLAPGPPEPHGGGLRRGAAGSGRRRRHPALQPLPGRAAGRARPSPWRCGPPSWARAPGSWPGAPATALAFLACVAAPFPGFRDLGLTAGLGLLACMVSSFLLLPALLLWPGPGNRAPSRPGPKP